MKQNFTKITLLFTLCLLSASVYGQRIYNVTVDGVEGTFPSVSSSLPGPCTETLAGEMVAGLPAEGCQALTNPEALAGKIAVLDRGTCNFTDKVRNAQAAGALAVIVCNNRPESSDGGGLIIMGGDDIEGLNTFAIMLSQESCAEFKANLPLNVNIGIDLSGFDLTAEESVLWGIEPGQGDFDGGLNGWSAVTIECNGAPSEVATWKYEADGISEGPLGDGISTGPSFCNGAMGFHSDFLDNGGAIIDEAGNIDESAVGTGSCPGPQIGELISPIIDLSGFDVAGVSIEFYQSTRQLNTSRYFVEYSIDGGENYVIAAEINTEIAGNEINSEIKVSLPLPGAAGTDRLRVKFTYIGNYYYWVIDDVKIIEREANNLRVNENFFATAPNVKVPRSQVDAINFLADIQNIGGATQENTNLNMTVTNDATGEVVYNSDLAYGDITADSIAENKLFESTFTPDDVVANYTGVYTVSSGSGEDSDPSDNSRTINFSVTENEFANEDGMNMGNIQITDVSQIPTWSLGNYFYLPKGNGWKVAKFGIGIGNADQVGGLEVGVRMFKWTDIDADSDDSGFPEAAPNEREFIGFADYEILGNELPSDVNEVTEIFNQDGDNAPILLEDEGHYIVMMTMDGEVGVAATDALYNNYLAMNLAATQAGKPRYWSFFGESSDIFETVYNANNNFTPLVRMFIEPEDASAVVELSADNLVTVGPNPAKEFVNIGMEFAKSFDEVNIMITDAAGRVVLMNDLNNIQNHQMRVDVSNLAAGIFLVNINTPEGVRTEKFIKVD